MKTTPTPDEALSRVFNAVAHPSRLKILDILRDGEACVCHIQAMLNQRQAYVSQHLNVLRNAGLVTSRKEGLRVYYQASDAQVFEVIDGMKAYLRSTGKWQPEEVKKDTPRQTCTCPQCTDKEFHIQLEAIHA